MREENIDMQNGFVFSRVLIAAAAMALPAIALAQAFPARPIHLVVPYPAGGTADVMARVLQPKLGAALGQPIVVDNRAGGNTIIGADAVARSAPDGYTLMLTTAATNTLVQFTTRRLPYDPIKDFTPIAAAGRSRGYIVVHPSLPVNNFKELIEYAKRNPGKLSYGTPNLASSFHLSGALLSDAAGVNWVHVPYKGGSAAMRAVMSGEIPMAIGSNGSAMPALVSGKIRLVAVLDADRDPKWPAVASVTELYPDFERTADWTGVFGPAGIPRPLVERLNAAINKALNDPDSVEKLNRLGLRPENVTPEQFSAMVTKAVEVNRRAVKLAGIKPQ
jgi:tripartite-type tricarboxylate transporter receptor subunit TctC